MDKTSVNNRGITLAVLLFMVMASIFMTGIPVSAASSIKNSTVTVKMSGSSNTALKISWDKCSGAQGYVVYRRESVKNAYTRIKKINNANTTTYLDKNLTSSKPYQYAVRAYRKENGKYVYSKYTQVIGATRPVAVKPTVKAVSSNEVTVSWTKNLRSDGYRIYRKASGGSWEFVADVAKTTASYSDTKVNANTKYVYTVRPYKKGGNVKYMAAVKQSSAVTTPKAVSQSAFTATQKDVMKKILYAVETGGQVYGNADYGCFVEAYTNSSAEHAITIGAGQWYGTEALRLLKLIRQTMGEEEWNKYDTGNHYLWQDMCNADWSKYQIKSSYWRAKVIVNLLKTDIGKKCQDQLMYEQIEEFETEIRKLGVTDIQAVGMFINIRHQGGYSAVTRVLAKTSKPYNLINVYKALASDTGNQVGAYKTRQAKVYQWLLTYMK